MCGAGGTSVPGQLEVSAIPVDTDFSPLIGGPPAHAVVDDDLQFTLTGLRGPRRIVLIRTPPGWALKSVTLNGIDVTDAPIPFGRADQSIRALQVLLTPHPAVLTGVVSAAGRTSANATVFVFGADRATWYVRSRFLAHTKSDRDGVFKMEGLPPGDYCVLAVNVLPAFAESEDWQDPEYLDAQMPRAKSVTLTEGARISVALTLDH